jgi:hypothetical protein
MTSGENPAALCKYHNIALESVNPARVISERYKAV